jgi:hypothetical protein
VLRSSVEIEPDASIRGVHRLYLVWQLSIHWSIILFREIWWACVLLAVRLNNLLKGHEDGWSINVTSGLSSKSCIRQQLQFGTRKVSPVTWLNWTTYLEYELLFRLSKIFTSSGPWSYEIKFEGFRSSVRAMVQRKKPTYHFVLSHETVWSRYRVVRRFLPMVNVDFCYDGQGSDPSVHPVWYSQVLYSNVYSLAFRIHGLVHLRLPFTCKILQSETLLKNSSECSSALKNTAKLRVSCFRLPRSNLLIIVSDRVYIMFDDSRPCFVFLAYLKRRTSLSPTTLLCNLYLPN